MSLGQGYTPNPGQSPLEAVITRELPRHSRKSFELRSRPRITALQAVLHGGSKTIIIIEVVYTKLKPVCYAGPFP